MSDTKSVIQPRSTKEGKNSNRLNGKDLINVGIYSALYLVIVFAVAMTGFIPIMMPLLCVLGPLLGGIPFMLYLTKVKKFGMILITSILMGIIMALTGMGIYALPVAIISGLAAELILKKANYSKSLSSVFAYGVFSVWMWGNFIPLFLDPAGYFSTRQEFGVEYAETLTSLLPMWMLPVLFIACIVFGIVGGFIGKAVLKKHFEKAGIA